jgi:membrane protease YdiL (CAAX protease family)
VTANPPAGGRIRAYLEFLAALIYFFLARSMARRAAVVLAADGWIPLAEAAVLLLVLIVGFAGLGLLFDRQTRPVSEQGLPLRPGWSREAGLGLTVGWGVALVCILPLALGSGIAIVLSPQGSSWGWLVADTLFFALLAMTEEVAFRGYAFQRFVRVVGPVSATLGFACFYTVMQAFQPGSSRASLLVSMLLSVLLSISYLRTRALWLSWGLNFGWKASRALLFGLAVNGVSSHSSVIEGDPMGPFWMTGGGYGLDGSWLTVFVLLAAFPVVYRVTRDLDFQHNAPVIVPAGIPVDLDATARFQHEAAQRGPAEPEAPALIQILPVAAPASNPVEKAVDSEKNGTR